MTNLQLRAGDGHTFKAYVARPEGFPKGAIVVVQEIFGVTGHIERVAEQYAAQGYLAIAPALFDRQQRGVNLPYDADGAAKGFALAHESGPRGSGGGRRRRRSTRSPMRGRSAWWATAGAGCYVPGRLQDEHRGRRRLLRRRHHATCCTTFRAARCCFTWREGPAHPAQRTSTRIRAAFPQGEYHLYAAGHGFNCTDRASFDAAAAHLAFARTLEFFRKHVG